MTHLLYLSVQTRLLSQTFYCINYIKKFISIPRVKKLVSGYVGRDPPFIDYMSIISQFLLEIFHKLYNI